MKIFGFAAIVVGLASLSSPIFAKDLIVCVGKSGRVTVALAEKRAFGHTLDCLYGGEFVSDMTPCAARNGYGFSAPTGTADLVGASTRWQDVDGASGGVVSSSVVPDRIAFTGSFHFTGGGGDDGPEWTFEIDRISGRAFAKLKDGRRLVYDCARRERRF